MNIVDLIEYETGIQFRKKTATEYAGPCPFCRDGEDRFIAWPKQGRFWCRVCDRKGDDIQFLRDYSGLDFVTACQRVGREPTRGKPEHAHRDHRPPNSSRRPSSNCEIQIPPGNVWTDSAWAFIHTCKANLMESNINPKALAWLHRRMLPDDTLRRFGIGYNPQDFRLDRSAWGLPPQTDKKENVKRLWLPRGIVIPWLSDDGTTLWGIRIRRPTGQPKYYWIPGGKPALYNVDSISYDRPAVLVEGEFDALTIAQAVGDEAGAVATGSTMGARRTKWIARLSLASAVLVAYDMDEAGEKAAGFWIEQLPNAMRWRPYYDDVNRLAQDGADIRSWVRSGVHCAQQSLLVAR